MHDTKIEMKIHEEIKPLEEVCKKLTEEFAANIDKAKDSDLPAAGAIVDMIKDLCEAKEKVVKACYYKYILGCMEKNEEEDKEEEKYFLRMLKEERADELKSMKEEYGEEDGEKRFYDNYRYANGRFAPKGRGSYEPRRSGRSRSRRGYEEMPYMMIPEMYDPMRDLDREEMGRMYYSGSGSSGGNSGGRGGSSSVGGSYGGNSGGSSSGMSSGSSGGSSRGYSEGYNDGEESGYQRGYSEGNRDGRRSNSGNSSRYDRARRGYEESKGKNGNSQEGNSENMRNLEKLLNIIGEDVKEYAPEMSQSEKAMARQKIDAMAKSIQ